jgi:DNA polymerase-3 subunit gamma/tau
MLTPQAFNALLKTLEEPPPHAKFVFATTEIRKVPVTVLSRCQRFDLRRVDTALLVEHLRGIAGKEQIDVEPQALALIARAAEGSVRDALSLFDQAIAHAGALADGGRVSGENVRQMLGLADRARVIDLFDALMRGDAAGALAELRDQYDTGADPMVVLSDLADFTNFVTRVKVVPAITDDVTLSQAERTRGHDLAAKLSLRVLSRTWQMLLKGIAEVKDAARPVSAAEMVLVRIAYAADLPTPDEVIRALGDNGQATTGAPTRSNAPAAAPAGLSGARHDAPRGAPRAALASAAPAGDPLPAAAAPTLSLHRFEDVVALTGDKRDLQMKAALERDVRLVRCEDGRLEVALEPHAAKTLVTELSRKLSAWTGKRWMVVVSAEAGVPTLKSQMDAQRAELMRGVRADPTVQAVLTRFPGAEIVGVRGPERAVPEGLAGPDDAEPPLADEDEDR